MPPTTTFYLPFARGARLFGWWWGGALASLVFSAAAWQRRRWNLAAAALFCTAAAIGGLWHHWCWNYAAANDLARFALEEPQPTCVEAVVDGRVEVSPPADRSPLRAIPARTMSEATVRVVSIRDGQRWRPAGGLSRLRVAGVLEGVNSGDRVRVFAQFARLTPPLNPGEYDWAAAERRNWRLSELYCEDPRCVAIRRSAAAIGVAAFLGDIRSWCERQLATNVRERDAPLVLATLLGDQERLNESTKDAFLKTGSIHLSVSPAKGAMSSILFPLRLSFLSLGRPESLLISDKRLATSVT